MRDPGERHETAACRRACSHAPASPCRTPSADVAVLLGRFVAGGRLAYYLTWILVVPEPVEARMPKMSVGGPLGERDLCDEFWLEPPASLHRFARQRQPA